MPIATNGGSWKSAHFRYVTTSIGSWATTTIGSERGNMNAQGMIETKIEDVTKQRERFGSRFGTRPDMSENRGYLAGWKDALEFALDCLKADLKGKEKP